MKHLEENRVPQNLRRHIDAIRFLLPLAYGCCNSNKISRVMIGYLTRNDFAPGQTAEPSTWFKPAEFSEDGKRLARADLLKGLKIAQTNPLPIWRPEIMLDCRYDDLPEEEYLQLLEILRCCLMGKKAIQGEKIRNSDNVDVSQKDSYHLGILTLNLSTINRQPFIGGHKRFPSFRRDKNCRVLPRLIFRNSAHIVALCEASDDHSGIAAHQELAKENSMIGMVVNAEITAPSIALFVRGSHEVGTFIELIVHHQSETEQSCQELLLALARMYLPISLQPRDIRRDGRSNLREPRRKTGEHDTQHGRRS